jgi:curved DNA-binding protein CbpA
MSDETHYAVLGISEAATQDEIERRYRECVAAYHVLSDSTQRTSYDQQLAQGCQQNAPSSPAPPKAAATPQALSLPFPPIEFGWDRGAYCLFPPRDTSHSNPRPQNDERGSVGVVGSHPIFVCLLVSGVRYCRVRNGRELSRLGSLTDI